MIVKKASYVVAINVTGKDELGRTTGICPHCGDEGHFAEDGQFLCPTNEALKARLSDAYEQLISAAGELKGKP